MHILLAIVIALLAFAAVAYRFSLKNWREEGWNLAKSEPPVEADEGKIPGIEGEKWLFAGPASNRKQSMHSTFAHYPIYFVRILYLYFGRFPRFFIGIARSSLRAGRLCYLPRITDQQIFDVFINGPLLVMSEMKGDTLEVKIPLMPLKTLEGINPGTLRLVFESKEKSIEAAEWQGENILNDKGKIMTLLVVTLAMWAHPQTHIAAERSAREIAHKRVNDLEPSNRFVVALHDGLLYGAFSPLTRDQPLSINVDKASGLEGAMRIKMPHRIDPAKDRFRYYHFLLEARKTLHRLLKQHSIAVNAEFLFNNMIVNSVDHHLLYQNLKHIPAWSLDGGTSLRSYWRSQVFVAVWVRHVVSPFETEHIRRMSPQKYPFYHALYTKLKLIDRDLGDCVLASTSF